MTIPGLYETIAWRNGELRHMDRHLERLAAGLRVWDRAPPPLDLADRARQAVHGGGLQDGVARVNLFIRFGARSIDDGWEVAASRHDPADDGPLRLTLASDVRNPLHTRHKILHAAEWVRLRANARQGGWEDVALLDAAGRLTETTTAALLFQRDGRLFRMASGDRLPSVAEAVLVDVLGAELATAEVRPDRLHEWDHAFAINVLRGARPVVALQGHALVADLPTWARLNRILLQ